MEAEAFPKSATGAVSVVAGQDAAVVAPPGAAPSLASSIARRFAVLAEAETAHGRAFLFAPVFLGLGALIWFSAARDMTPAIHRVGFLVALVLALFFRHRSRALGLSAAAVALVAAGMWLAANETARKATILLDSAVTVDIAGRVVSREAVTGGGWRYVVDVTMTRNPALKRPPRRVAILTRGRHAPIESGQGIAGRARLSPPSGPALPGLSDFAFASYFGGVGATGFLYGAPKPVDLAAPAGKGLLAEVSDGIGRLRGVIGERIRAVLPGDAGAFATAMVTDERRAMTRATAEALRLSGLAHIIAISGLNMALSAGIFFVGLRMALSLHQGLAHAFPVKKIAAVGALAGVTAYYLLSGSAVSAERAWLMMSIMLVAVLLGRPSISMRNVALAALVILVLSPSDIMGASFQMSFAATAALVAGYSLLRDRDEDDPRPVSLPAGLAAAAATWRFFWGIALTSIIGGASTAIFSVAHFQQLAVWGLPANLAAMPVVSFVVMPAGLLAMLLMPFGLDEWPLRIMGFGLDLVIAIAREVSSWGGEGGAGLLPPFVFPAVVAGLLILTLLKTRLRLIGAALAATALALAFLLPAPPPPAIVIAESGDLVGLVGENAIATNRERPQSFIFAQWRRALKRQAHVKPTVLPVTSSSPNPAATRMAPGSALNTTAEGIARGSSPDMVPAGTARNSSLKTLAAGLSQGSSPDTTAAGSATGTAPARRTLATAEIAEAKDAMKAALADIPAGRFTCREKAWCIATVAAGEDAAATRIAIAVLEDAAFVEPACAIADIVVTRARLRTTSCTPASATGAETKGRARLLTGATLSRSGALAIRFAPDRPGSLLVEEARNGSSRPWNRHRLYDWRSDAFHDDDGDAVTGWEINDSGE